MIDFSAVAHGMGEADARAIAEGAKTHRFIGAMVMPCYAPLLVSLLEGIDDVLPCTVVGFPSGASHTRIKVEEARLAVAQGCREIDMVMNIGAMLSGRDAFVEDDIRAVVQAAGAPVKVIIELHYLNDDQVKRSCECILKAGAHFVKTSTGWAPTGATTERVALVKSFVGDALPIKAAGGIRSLAALLEMHAAGARRFGVSAAAALKILEECGTK
jgi:deoxyribose-phosphate aldolase